MTSSRSAVAAGGKGKAAAPLSSIVAAVTAVLGARYQEAWPLALPGGQPAPLPLPLFLYLSCDAQV